MTTQVKRLLVSALRGLEQEMSHAGGMVETPARPKSRQGKKTIVGHFEPGVSWQLKKLALDRRTTVQALLEEALGDLFEKHHLPRG